MASSDTHAEVSSDAGIPRSGGIGLAHRDKTATADDMAASGSDTATAGATDGAPVQLLGLTQDEMVAWMQATLGTTAFRGRQLFGWTFRQRAASFSAMGNLPAALQERLSRCADIARPRIDMRQCSADGTRKYRFVAADHSAFEAVYIPEVATGRGTNTLCISSQTGCAVGCKFCFTASLRRNRNLSVAEIVGQVVAVQDDLRPLGPAAQATNVVFMGMGEPLLNYDNVVKSVKVLADPHGLAFGYRRITISTSGIVPRLLTLGHDVPVQLAISLNATRDDMRTAIMPINKKWPLAVLLAALRAYPLGTRRRITVEYVLLGGYNDTAADARRLVALLSGIPVKVNLLPLNPHVRTTFVAPSEAAVTAFQASLRQAGVSVFVRRPRGQDIQAACGQLGEARAAAKPIEDSTPRGQIPPAVALGATGASRTLR